MSRTYRQPSLRLRSQMPHQRVQSIKHSEGTVNVTDVTSTPTQNGIAHLRQKLEDHLEGRGDVETDDNISPGLARLRSTPGRLLRDKQEFLIKKHDEARQRSDQLNVGGGVSLWPQMDRMKLTKGETAQLVIINIALATTVIYVFQHLHGSSMSDMKGYIARLRSFPRNHVIDTGQGEETFRSSLVAWHSDYRHLLSEIQKRFEMVCSSAVDMGFLAVYVCGLITLLYYLLDNMAATSKLSPRRVKKWVSLLVVITVWTGLMVSWLVLAHQLEYAVEDNIHNLSEILGDLVNTELDLQVFHTVLEYWRTRSLPPTTHGVLTILGMLPVRDVMYYLQYYSLPIITVLLTPVIKLIRALYTVYKV